MLQATAMTADGYLSKLLYKRSLYPFTISAKRVRLIPCNSAIPSALPLRMHSTITFCSNSGRVINSLCACSIVGIISSLSKVFMRFVILGFIKNIYRHKFAMAIYYIMWRNRPNVPKSHRYLTLFDTFPADNAQDTGCWPSIFIHR